MGFAVFLVSFAWRVWAKVVDGYFVLEVLLFFSEKNRFGTSLVEVTRIVLANMVLPGSSGLVNRPTGLRELRVSRLKLPSGNLEAESFYPGKLYLEFVNDSPLLLASNFRHDMEILF